MLTIDDYMRMPHRSEITEDDEEGGFVAQFPELPGCITCAETKEDVIRNALDAKRAWLEAAIEDGIAIAVPEEKGTRLFSIEKGQQPTEEQLLEIEEAKKYPITFDEDSPELSPAMHKAFQSAVMQTNKKKKRERKK